MEGLSANLALILDAARSAPSHDNLQPWRFVVEGDVLSLGLDHERLGDATAARIALGAAVECVYVAAARAGATVRVLDPREGALVTLSITDPKRLPEPDLARTRRVTNRRAYDGRALDDATLRALKEASPARGHVHTQWFGRERARALAPLVEEAEELLFLDEALRARALGAVRFDAKDKDEVTTGLSLGSLELTTAERATLTGMRKTPRPAEAKKLGARARRLLESASGVCVITAGPDPADDIDVGRAVQRAWMVLTKLGMAAQPMTTPITLPLAFRTLSDLDGARDTIPDALDVVPVRARALGEALRRAFPNLAHDARVAFLLRFGWAEAPSCRVGRLPIEAVTTVR